MDNFIWVMLWWVVVMSAFILIHAVSRAIIKRLKPDLPEDAVYCAAFCVPLGILLLLLLLLP